MKLKNIGLISLVAISLAACSQVDNGTRGVEVFNGRATAVHSEGLVWYFPVTTDIILMDVKTLKWTSETIAYTKDVQQASIKFSLNYNLDPGAVLKTYKTVGEDWDSKLVEQIVLETIKDQFGKAEAVTDAINNRGILQTKIFGDIKRKLAAKNVIVTGFNIQNIDFSEAFENAVEAKQVAVENANTAKNKTVQVNEEARQRITAAEADARAISIKAQALSQNPKYADLELIAAWRATGGKVPTTVVVGSNGTVPLMPIGLAK